MALRLVITDAVWAEIAPVLRTIKHDAGRPPRLSDRMFIEAVLSQARTGIPWRDLPDDFGHWDAVYNRLRRWEARAIWKQLWHHGQHHGCQLAHPVCIEATIRRAHQPAAGAHKKRGARGPGSWPLSGRIVSQAPCRLHRRQHGRLPAPDQWGAA